MQTYKDNPMQYNLSTAIFRPTEKELALSNKILDFNFRNNKS